MSPYLLISFIACAINASLAFYVLILEPRARLNRIFCAGFLFVSAWNFTEGMMRGSGTMDEAFAWSRVMLAVVFFIPSFILYFSLAFATHPFARKFSTAAFIFIPPVLFTLFFPPYIHEGIVPTAWGYDYAPGPLLPLFSLLYLLICVFSAGIFYKRYFTRSRSERTIFFILLFGFTFPALLGLFTNLFSRLLGVMMPRLGSLFSVFISLSFLYAIKRHKFLIVPMSEKRREGHPAYALEKGESYLFLEQSPQKSYQIFSDMVSHGAYGLVIARTHPQKIRQRLGLEKTPVFWLSSIREEQSLEPQNLSKVLFIVSSFLEESTDSIVLLEGLEYLISSNSFESVLKFLYLLDDAIVSHSSRLVLPLNPDILTEKELSLIGREMVVLPSRMDNEESP